MIVLRVSESSSRLIYTADLIFQQLLGVNYQLIQVEDSLPEDVALVLDYSGQEVSTHLSIPNAGLLHETKVYPQKFETREEEFPILFFIAPQSPTQLNFDIFSATFYLVTEYEKWAHPQYDSHGRYDELVYESYKNSWYKYPLVHKYVDRLWDFITEAHPGLERTRSSFSFQLSFDIDHPWKYLKKSLFLQAGGMAKDLLSRNLNQAKERTQALMTGRDPHQCFPLIFEHCAPRWTRFFFLLDRASPHDGRFTYEHAAYRELIQHIHSKGYPVGIHPSYTSFLDEERIGMEREKLEEISQQEILSSRQHYLRYRYPETFQFLLKAGIREEYSLVNYHTGGFRTGMAQPYPWFDLSTNQQTELILHPTTLMDVSLTQYQQLSPEEGMSYARELVQVTREVGGTFLLLLHNDTLSESGMWKGWRKHWLGLIREVRGES